MSISKYGNKFNQIKKILLSDKNPIHNNPFKFKNLFKTALHKVYIDNKYKYNIINNDNSSRVNTYTFRNSYKNLKNNLLLNYNTTSKNSKSVKTKIKNIYEKFHLSRNSNTYNHLYSSNKARINTKKHSTNFSHDKNNINKFQLIKNENFYLGDHGKTNNYIFNTKNKNKKNDNYKKTIPVNFKERLFIEKVINFTINNNKDLILKVKFDNHKFYDSTGINDYEYNYDKYYFTVAENKNKITDNFYKNNKNDNLIKICPSIKMKEENFDALASKNKLSCKIENFTINNNLTNIKENSINTKEISVDSKKFYEHIKEINFFESPCNYNKANKLRKNETNISYDIISNNSEGEEIINYNDIVYNTDTNFFKKSRDNKSNFLQKNNIIIKSNQAQEMLDSLLLNMRKKKRNINNRVNKNTRSYSYDKNHANNTNLIGENCGKGRMKLFDEEEYKNIFKKNSRKKNYNLIKFFNNFGWKNYKRKNIIKEDKIKLRTRNNREKRDKIEFLKYPNPCLNVKTQIVNLKNKIMPPNDIFSLYLTNDLLYDIKK